MTEQSKPEQKQDHKAPQKPEKKERIILTTGKRKKAVARARFRSGKGLIRMNTVPIDKIENELMRLRLMEPLIIAGNAWKAFDVRINVRGGGTTGQIDAARQALARGMVEIVGESLKEKYMSMDRNLLVFDPRRTEPHKPPRSSQGPRRYKQRSKR